MNIQFRKDVKKASDVLIVPVYDNDGKAETGKTATQIDDKFLSRFLKTNKKFTGKKATTLVCNLPEGSPDYAVFIGLGKRSDVKANTAQDCGGALFACLKNMPVGNASLLLDKSDKSKALSHEEMAAHLAYGLKLRSYKYDRYKSKSKDDQKPISDIDIVVDGHDKAKKSFETLDKIASGVFLARDLLNDAPNDLYPESFADIAQKELNPLGVEIDILDEKKMLKMGMGAIMAVGQGSVRQPRMVIMTWNGGKKSDDPVLLVGKGVTFDTGGISLKPGAGMEDMKMDMGGAAAVVGTMKAIAGRKAKANVIGIIGLAENMPSSNAYRPGDVITSYSGKTIEVLNTDAEGRLVLADCLTYGQEICKNPAAIIDLATLTGAMMVALAHEYCGTFVNDDSLWSSMEKASQATGEKLWRMPLDEAFKKSMEGDFGDLQNLSKMGRWGGACTAAGFLEAFVEEGTPWAHMDIAGTAWIKKDLPTVPKFGTGFGVRVLDALIAENYEG